MATIAELIAAKKAQRQEALAQALAQALPMDAFISLILQWDGWARHDPIGALLLLIDWLQPMCEVAPPRSRIPSIHRSWQIAALAMHLELEPEQVWFLITAAKQHHPNLQE